MVSRSLSLSNRKIIFNVAFVLTLNQIMPKTSYNRIGAVSDAVSFLKGKPAREFTIKPL